MGIQLTIDGELQDAHSRSIDQVLIEYLDKVKKIKLLHGAQPRIPTGSPVLVSYAGVYRCLDSWAGWMPGEVVGYWGHPIVEAKVKVNAMKWQENCRIHNCKIRHAPVTDPKTEILVKVPLECVQIDRTILCLLSDKPHHPDFSGNAVPHRFLHELLCKYNSVRHERCRNFDRAIKLLLPSTVTSFQDAKEFMAKNGIVFEEQPMLLMKLAFPSSLPRSSSFERYILKQGFCIEQDGDLTVLVKPAIDLSKLSAN